MQSILAQAYFMAGRYDDSIALCQKILETDAKHLEARSTLAESYNSLAIDEKNKKDAAIVLSYHQKAFDIRQQLANEHPENAKYNANWVARSIILACCWISRRRRRMRWPCFSWR